VRCDGLMECELRRMCVFGAWLDVH
jgi:hypothetical protein